MARRRKTRRKKSALDYIALPKLDLDPDTKRGIFIVFILAIGAISLLGLFDLAGMAGNYIKQFLIIAFGWGKWIFPFILLLLGFFLYNEEKYEIRFSNYLGVIIFLLSFHALLFLFIERDQWENALKIGSGGGYVGLLLASNFLKLMGFFASLIVTFGLLIISFLLMFNTTLIGLFGRESLIAKILFPINFIISKLFKSKDEEEDEDEEDEDDDEDEEEDEDEDDDEDEEEDEDEEDEDDDEDEEEDEDEEDEDDDEDEEDGEKIPKFSKSLIKDEEELWWKTKTNVDINLPLSLLNSKKGKPTSGDIKANKEIIKHTLENFHIPVEMGDISVGPTVTQYTFRPAEGIKVSKISNLSNDLALALAAHPIRIEAPIPGKSLIGVEVPNQAKAIVGLKEILSVKDYKKRKNNLMIALGKDVSGKAWLDDISKMPHLLVAGATNSGKSVCLNSIIISLMYQNNPDDLRFIMVDPKRVELPVYNNIPYLLTPVITDVKKTINALKWCLNEMDRRFEVLSKFSKRNIQTYNESTNIKMPYVIFIIDELADLMVAASRDIEAGVIRLAQMARAVGIHLILATQRPSVDIITGVIKANMPARAAFSVASGIDSRTILDTLGAEKLLGRGDMLFMNAEMSKPKRLQGAFVSDLEIKKIVRYIKDKNGTPKFLEDITERQKVQGIGGVGLDGNEDEDELLGEAKEIVINMNKASASLLQRKLRVGYARAASLLDALEEAGVVGPSNGSKPREILISKEEYEAILDQEVSGVALHDRDEAEPPKEFLENEEEEDEDDESDEEENREDEENDEEDEDESDDEGDEEDEEEDEEEGEDEDDKEDDEGEKEEEGDEIEDKLFAK